MKIKGLGTFEKNEKGEDHLKFFYCFLILFGRDSIFFPSYSNIINFFKSLFKAFHYNYIILRHIINFELILIIMRREIKK